MVVVKSHIMYSCKVFYIGSGHPSADKKGVEALQQPLRDRYRGNVSAVEGFDVTITIMPDVVHIEYSNNAEPEFSLPISTLSICAAVRCIESHTDPSNMKFVPVHSVITAHEPDSDHPAIFTTVMKRHRESTEPIECHAFICNSTRDALHLVNATQTAHTALRRGYSPSGAMKFFIDQSTEFDRTLRLPQANASRKTDVRKMYTYQEDFDTRVYNADTNTYVASLVDTDDRRTNRFSKVYNETNDISVQPDSNNTYYVQAGEYRNQTPPPAVKSETVVIKVNAEHMHAPTPPPQQTIVIDKPIVRDAPPQEYPKPKIIERPVYIDPPPVPKMEPQIIYVDKPIFREQKWPNPPAPIVQERPVYIDPPPPPRQEPQKIIVDKPIMKDYPPPPLPPAPIIEENPVYFEPPQWPKLQPQRIIVDKPIMRAFDPPPAPPPPIIEERPVYIDPPEYPKQQPQRIVVEKPVFNQPKPAPRPPTPIIEERQVFIDPPPFPRQEPQRIIIEKPCIRDPGPPPPPPKPIIIEKPVYIDPPQYQQQEPQRIIVEKPVMRDRGPPPPPPPPIIIEKIVYIDPPPWPVQEPQRIIVEKPVFRQRPMPPPPKPIIIEKPVYIDAPGPPVREPQRIVVEKPVVRTTYGLSETRRVPSVYNYHYQTQPANIRSSSYVVRADQPRRLRRYAWSEVGDERMRSNLENGSEMGRYRVFGQPRDFRRQENMFINERGFGRRINEEMRRGPNSYTNGFTYKLNDHRGSVSS